MPREEKFMNCFKCLGHPLNGVMIEDVAWVLGIPNSDRKIWGKSEYWYKQQNSRWWFHSYFFNFHHKAWGNDPIWLIFFSWVETTNLNSKMIQHDESCSQGSLVLIWVFRKKDNHHFWFRKFTVFLFGWLTFAFQKVVGVSFEALFSGALFYGNHANHTHHVTQHVPPLRQGHIRREKRLTKYNIMQVRARETAICLRVLLDMIDTFRLISSWWRSDDLYYPKNPGVF